MKRTTWLAALALATMVAALAAPLALAGDRTSGGFNATSVKGFRTGEVSVSGGASFDLTTGVGHGGGGFSCLQDVGQGPLTGCLAGQGVRWDSDTVLRSTQFKCTGAATEALKPAATGPGTLVLKADFYRAGDANNESFTAQMIVSVGDLAPEIDGIQHVWVQGVGCGTSVGSFG